MLMESSLDQPVESISSHSPLEMYLYMESQLNEFFSLVDFCYSGCITQEKGKFPLIQSFGTDDQFVRGDVGCCLWDQFLNHTPYVNEIGMNLLEKSRLERYGLPHNKEEPVKLPFDKGYAQACAYHTEEGCILKDHKSSICIAYICPSLYSHLSSKYNIFYDRARAGVILDRTLSDTIEKKEQILFLEQIEQYKKKICDIKPLKD
jgi:hypothetical protein